MPKTQARRKHGRDDTLMDTITGAGKDKDRAARMKKRDRVMAAKKRERRGGLDADEEEEFVPARISRVVLDEARKQRQEIEAEEQQGMGGAAGGAAAPADIDDDEEDDGDEEEFQFGGDEGLALDGEGFVVEGNQQLSAEDEALVRQFMGASAAPRQSLADAIMASLGQGSDGAAPADGAMQDEGAAPAGTRPGGITPRVEKVFSEVGAFLAKYKSGKLPKVVKMLPALHNWLELLLITDPDSWSPHATFALTRIFASNLDARRAQAFFNIILLPRVRNDIGDSKKLSYHLYASLLKALYKPAAFFKGILLPLAKSGTCTLKEATIFASVLKRKHIPADHSAIALLKLAQMRYTGAASIMMRAIIDKKYALPLPIVDAVVAHFAAFQKVPAPLPVIWHQCLLSFSQRYKTAVTRAQKVQLRGLLKKHNHPGITPEIRRELFNSPSRDDAGAAAAATGGASRDVAMR